MKKDYSGLSYDELHSEYKRLNRRLIVPNILIAIIAIVACLSQFLMPFFKVNIKLNSEVVSAVVDTIFEDDESLVDDDSNEILAAVLTKDNIKSAAKNLNNSIPLELTAQQMLSIAFATDDVVEDTIIEELATVVEKMNLKDQIESALNALMPSVVSTAVAAVVSEQIITNLNNGEELTEAQTEAIETAATTIENSLQKLSESTPETIETVKEEVKTEVQTTITNTMSSLEFSDEEIEEVQDVIDTYYDEFVDAAVDEEGNFSYVTLMENLDSLIENLSNSGEISDEDAEKYGDLIENLPTSDAEGAMLASYTLTADSTDTDSESTTATINYYLDLLDNPKEFIEVVLDSDGDGVVFDEDTIATIQLVCEGLFIFIAFVSVLWAILALLAILHIFMGNKKVGMWYVKLFGGLAAIIFYLVPVALIMSIGTLSETLAATLGDSAEILTTLSSALSFGGSGLIVLICLLALWIVSIFVCHPAKKKIKRCKKALKAAKKAEA